MSNTNTYSEDVDADVKVVLMNHLRQKSPMELMSLAEKLGVVNSTGVMKQELVMSIVKSYYDSGFKIISEGVVEVMNDGFAFARSSYSNYLASPDDMYISPSKVKKMGLRTGDIIEGEVRVPKKDERYCSLVSITKVNYLDIKSVKRNVHFDSLKSVYPDKHLRLECDIPFRNFGNTKDVSGRTVDIASPFGIGQRALIVAPPKTGKTFLMQNIAHSISVNYPDIQLIVLLIGERPEEVTDMERSVNGEVISSTFDEPAHRHVQLSEIVIEKARRMVERKMDVVILLDSMTRLARAYNAVVPSSGKVLTGGVDSNALQRPKRFFGAARNIENGGSLTIIATALIDTGSKMDEVIFEEFKGTGNSEIVLDRRLSDKRVFPSIDIMKSGTRREELLYDRNTLSKIWILRRILSPMGPVDATEFLHDKLIKTKDNNEFFESMRSSS